MLQTSLKQTSISNALIFVASVGICLPILSSYLLSIAAPDFVWIQELFHSVVEICGSFIAFIASAVLIFFISDKITKDRFWIAYALLAMGILDGMHASIHVGNVFVWLHSSATFMGGILFALVWLPVELSDLIKIRLAILVSVATVVFGVLSIYFAEYLPAMTSGGEFSNVAKGLNIGGGMLFYLAALRFLIQRKTTKDKYHLIFAAHCTIFGSAGILFEISELWDAVWWWWHVLRLIAYGVLFEIIFSTYLQTVVSREYLNNIIRSMHDALIVLDQKGIIQTINQSLLAILKYTEKDLLEKKFSGLIVEGYSDAPALQALIKNGEGSNVNVQFYAKDGRKVSMSLAAAVMLDAREQVYRIVIIARDMSEINKLVEELRIAKTSSERHVQLLMDSTADAIYGVDLNGNCTWANRACLKMLGYTELEGLLGHNMHALIHHTKSDGTNYPEDMCHIFRAMREQSGAHIDNEVFWRKDNTSFPAEYWSYPIYEEGNIVGVVVTFMDITKRREAEEVLKNVEKANAYSEAANHAKSEFLANMSHEIRTPMNAIIGMSDLAMQSDSMVQVQDYIAKIDRTAHSLLSLINDILDLSKIEAGKLTLESASFNLCDLFDYLADLFRTQVQQKNIAMSMWGPINFPHDLLGDQVRLRQVFINLISNAIKFTESGKIIVESRLMDNTTKWVKFEFSVRDTGIGLTEEQISGLFSSFSQADNSITRKYGGTGLGLAICKQLVEIMGGRIGVESKPAEGSRFFFTLEFEKLKAKKLKLIPPHDMQGIKVLVVDDDQLSREMLTMLSQSFTFITDSANSGINAVDAVFTAIQQNSPYALILMDGLMPGMNGIETSLEIERKIAENLSNVTMPKIIILTDSNVDEVKQLAKEKICPDVVLNKPVSMSLLFNTIMAVFGKQEAIIAKSSRSSEKADILKKIGGSKVLLVDDNGINQQVAQRVLENVGVVVKIANNGVEAVNMIKRYNFDAVLMDIQMPKMDGVEATRQARNEFTMHELPIIAMTAHVFDSDRKRCLDVGMNDYLTKPIDPKLLYECLVKWIKLGDITIPKINGVASQENVDHESKMPFDIPGIDVEAVLERLSGNHELFAKLLRELVSDCGNMIAKIRDCLGKGDGKPNFASAWHLAHAIKGMAGNLSAANLQQAAHALEIGIRTGQQDEWPVLLDGFDCALSQLEVSIDMLNQDEKACVDTDVVMPPMDLDVVALRVRELFRFLRDADPHAEECFDALKSLLLGAKPAVLEELKHLEAHIDKFEFKDAHASLDYLAGLVEISVEDDAT